MFTEYVGGTTNVTLLCTQLRLGSLRTDFQNGINPVAISKTPYYVCSPTLSWHIAKLTWPKKEYLDSIQYSINRLTPNENENATLHQAMSSLVLDFLDIDHELHVQRLKRSLV